MEPRLRKAEHLKIDPPVEIECKKPVFKQNWAVISFISPEDRIKQRFLYDANRFLYHDINKQIIDTTTNVVRNVNTSFNNLLEKKIASYKSSKDPTYKHVAEILDSVRKELPLNEDDQIDQTLRTYRIDQAELTDRFETYKVQNDKELEADFSKENGEEVNVRGFKVRGTFEKVEGARERAKMSVNRSNRPFTPSSHPSDTGAHGILMRMRFKIRITWSISSTT